MYYGNINVKGDFPMNIIEAIKEDIRRYNRAYRAGTPIISDQEFDDRLEELANRITPEDFETFRNSLSDVTDSKDIKHSTVIGSLDKVKAEDKVLPETLKTLCPSGYVVAMPKIDGMSFVATYVNGRLSTVASRGDGYVGEDMTEKGKLILPNTVKTANLFEEYRGEFTLTGNDHEKLGYKNRRNGTVGVMKAKTWKAEDVKLVKGIVYQIITSDLNRFGQIEEARSLGFDVVQTWSTGIGDLDDTRMTEVLKEWRTKLEYDIDGLVLCDALYVSETDAYIPKGMVAYKVNDQVAVTTVKTVEWNVSKQGYMKPVVIIEPVDLCGVTIGRVAGFNARNIIENKIDVGAVVEIVRSGDVIPKINKVLTGAEFVAVPNLCPSCGEQLGLSDVELVCTNENCGRVTIMKVESFIKELGIENASAKSFIKWGIETLDDLLTWKPGSGANEKKFYAELLRVMFTAPYNKLMAAMDWNGSAGSKTTTLILKHYGDKLNDGTWRNLGFPEGVGERTMEVFMSCWKENSRLVDMVRNDKRYNEVAEETPVTKASGITGLSFCITGTLSKPRKHFETLITENGGVLGSVSKNLNYLVMGADAGSKEEKAKKLGIKIITEQELLTMI